MSKGKVSWLLERMALGYVYYCMEEGGIGETAQLVALHGHSDSLGWEDKVV